MVINYKIVMEINNINKNSNVTQIKKTQRWTLLFEHSIWED